MWFVYKVNEVKIYIYWMQLYLLGVQMAVECTIVLLAVSYILNSKMFKLTKWNYQICVFQLFLNIRKVKAGLMVLGWIYLFCL